MSISESEYTLAFGTVYIGKKQKRVSGEKQVQNKYKFQVEEIYLEYL